MKLSVLERLILLNLLPREGNVEDLRILRELVNVLGLTEAEVAKNPYESAPTGGLQATGKPEFDVDIEMGHRAQEVILKALKALEKQNKLPLAALDLYDRLKAAVEEASAVRRNDDEPTPMSRAERRRKK